MFEYFPGNYTWSQLFAIGSSIGIDLEELHKICEPLKANADRLSEENQKAAYEAWSSRARYHEERARQAEAAGHVLTAARHYSQACRIYLVTEVFCTAKHLDKKVETYQRVVDCFSKSATLNNSSLQFVEVPFEGQSLSAIFMPAYGDAARAPCMVHFDGFDWNKEFVYFTGQDGLARRGVSVLFVDTPGVGSSRRFKDMPVRVDSEAAGTACLEYLLGREDVDPGRIGVMGLSMGGYYAPRAAAFEHRFACCVAWNVLWDAQSALEHEKEMGTESLPDQEGYILWVTGEETMEKAIEKLFEISLEGLVEKIACPFLATHGEGDRQIPLWHAERAHERATKARPNDLRIFTSEEGGAEHCQIENFNVATDYIYDWIADIFGIDQRDAALPRTRELI